MTAPKGHVWVIDDDRSIRWVLEKALEQANIQVTAFDRADSALRQMLRQKPDALITDIRMPGMDGLDLLKQVNELYPGLPVIIMTAHSDLESAVASYQGGAFEYLPKPFDVDEAVALARRALAHADEQKAKSSGHTHEQAVATQTTEIIGEAPAMQEVFRAIGRLSHSTITV
ncbi:MAG: response regulator, partial [Marinospirillum sp.]|uniref:response regulator n=1 Tax=Marinospirillum sp. TaxID=2183934 RepID=UPI001A034811